ILKLKVSFRPIRFRRSFHFGFASRARLCLRRTYLLFLFLCHTGSEIAEQAYFFCDFFFLGTLAPFSRASERPIAIACFLLVTLRPLPDCSVPFFLLRIARFTDSCAFFEYFAITRYIFFNNHVFKCEWKNHAGMS